MPRKGQVKKFAPKVRSGCVTCKRRHIKCDESRPSCGRCLQKGLRCEGFRVPKTWLFETTPKRAGTPFHDLKSGTADVTSDEDSREIQSKFMIPPERYQHDSKFTLQRNFVNLTGDAVEGQSLQFWLDETAPNLASYGPHGDIWEILIPSMSQEYAAVKHVLLAAAMLDESKGFSVNSLNLRARSLRHYQAAISTIVSKRQPYNVIIVISLIAWVFETMLGDLSAASIHIKAALRLAQEVGRSPSSFGLSNQYVIEPSMRTCLLLANGYSQAMFSDSYSSSMPVLDLDKPRASRLQQFYFKSLAEAQKAIKTEIEEFHSKPDSPESAERFRMWLREWQKAMIAYRWHGAESLLHKRATHLFFNIAMALLPPYEVGCYSHEVDAATTEHVLTMIELVMKEMSSPCCNDRGLIHEVLRSLVETTFRCFPEIVTTQHRQGLLQRLNVDLANLY